MLKITTHETGQSVRLQIEGALSGCWVRELEMTWQAARVILKGRSLWVDLIGTTRVDTAGYYLLALMHKEGVQFLASGPAMRELISEITNHETVERGANGRPTSTERADPSGQPEAGTDGPRRRP